MLFNKRTDKELWKKIVSAAQTYYKNVKFSLVIGNLLFLCAQAQAVWFDVDNYEGKIGEGQSHVSLQKKTYAEEGSFIVGDYYYDKNHTPILLYGTYEGSDIFLCEFNSNGKFEPFPKKTNFNDCEFRLKVDGDKLVGQWKNKTISHPVELIHTISFDSVGVEDFEKKIEIPFWGQTREHAFIGIYERVNDEMQINKINVISKKSGKLIQIINPQKYGCGFGFYMTYIYRHIVTENDMTVELHCNRSEYVGNTRFYQYNKKKGKYVYIKDYLDKYYK